VEIGMAEIRIGTSGWHYKHWIERYYPAKLPASKMLAHYQQDFDTVEINNSFYRLPQEETFKNWRKRVPNGFIFAVKASRFLTHIKRLKDPEEPLELFFSRATYLKDRLGPVLFQLPPQMKADLERLETFLHALKTHSVGKKVRSVLEVRDATWLTVPVFALLKKYRVALCFADWRDLPITEPVTSDFVYVRRHYGPAGGGNYGKRELDRNVAQIRNWIADGFDVYVYFNNDLGGHAIRNAKYVRDRLRN
jgi:uncharacterized protein YecE (DUF72 family)